MSAYSRYLTNMTASLGANLLHRKIGETSVLLVHILRFLEPPLDLPAVVGQEGVFLNCLGCTPKKQEIGSVSTRHWNEERLAVGLMEAS